MSGSGSGSAVNGLGGGQSPDVPEPGQAGYAEHGYPPVSPYPPVPDDEPASARPAGGSYGGVSPYPVYRPYGPEEDDGAGDALTDYGLPSPQAYGFAPPPPPVEPLPDLGTPERGYRNEPYEPPGHRDGAPGQEERGQAAASPPGPAGRRAPPDRGDGGPATGRGHGERPAERGLRGPDPRTPPRPAPRRPAPRHRGCRPADQCLAVVIRRPVPPHLALWDRRAPRPRGPPGPAAPAGPSAPAGPGSRAARIQPVPSAVQRTA